MKEVIRLIRLSLALRILAAAASAILMMVVAADPGMLLQCTVVLPSLILLILLAWAPRRGWIGPRFVKGALIAMILAYTAEIAVSAILFRLVSPNVTTGATEWIAPDLRPWRAIMQFGFSLRPAPVVPLVFILIPAILGAWLDGQRNGLRWAAFTALMSSAGIIIFVVSEPEQFISSPWRTLGIGEFVAQAVVIFVVCYFVGSLADQQRAEQVLLEAANRQLAEQAHVREHLAASRERARLARDLHDTLAHTLAGLAVQIHAIGAMIKGEQPDMRRELEYAGRMAEEGLVSTRQAIGDLRASAVDDLGLVEALRRQAEQASQRGGVQVSFEHGDTVPELSDETSNALYRIAQEALANVERHAQAQHAVLALRSDGGAVELSVADDGIGFDPADLDDQQFGLRGMRERAELAGARLRVDSTVGEGTRVTLTVPAPASR